MIILKLIRPILGNRILDYIQLGYKGAQYNGSFKKKQDNAGLFSGFSYRIS